jgi:glutathione S-transferase
MSHGFAYFSNPVFVGLKNCREYVNVKTITEPYSAIQITTFVYPSNVQDRAKARQVQAWLRSDVLALREDRTTEVIFYKPSLIALTPVGKVAAEKLIQVATLLLGDGRQNLFGSWSIADTDLALMLNRLIFSDDPVPEFLKKYAEVQWQNQAIREWVKMTRPVVR